LTFLSQPRGEGSVAAFDSNEALALAETSTKVTGRVEKHFAATPTLIIAMTLARQLFSFMVSKQYLR